MHHFLMMWLIVLLLLMDVRVVASGCWGDWTSRSLMVDLVLLAVHEVLALWCDGWCHVTIDHVSVWLLWCTWVKLLGLGVNWLLGDLTRRCWWAGTAVHGFLVTEEVVESGGDARHVWSGVFAEENLRRTVKLLR